MPEPGCFEEKRREMPSSGWMRRMRRLGRGGLAREEGVGDGAEADGDIGDAFRHAFAAADVEGRRPSASCR
jgi:hypothetical protein